MSLHPSDSGDLRAGLVRFVSLSLSAGVAASGLELILAVKAEPEVMAWPAEFLPAAGASLLLTALAVAVLWILVTRLLSLAAGPRVARSMEFARLARAGPLGSTLHRTGSGRAARSVGVFVRLVARSAPLMLVWSGLWLCFRNSGSLEHEYTRIDMLILAAGGIAIGAAGWWFSARTRMAVLALTSLGLIAAGSLALHGKSRFLQFADAPAPVGDGERQVRRVLLLTADALRTDSLSCYRNDAPSTPHLDTLASDSVLFLHAYSASSWTLPSLGSIMTGLPPLTHQLTNTGVQLPTEFPTLAQQLQQAGYATAAVVENTILDPSINLFRGFGEVAAFPRRDRMLHEPLGRWVLRRLFRGRFPLGGSREVTETVVEWLRRNRERDFFLWVHYYDPHVPYDPPAEFRPPHRPPDSIGPSFHDSTQIRLGRMLTARERNWIRLLYEAEVRFMDHEAGRVLSALRELGLYDDTLIIFTSDHGEEFWEHGGYEHGHALYEEVVRVPLMVKLPGSTAPAVVDSRVTNWSLMPAVLDLTGSRSGMECGSGPSLSPYLKRSPSGAFGQEILLSSLLYFQDQMGLITGNHKYIRKMMDDRDEIYNLRRDPEERKPLTGGDTAIKKRLADVSKRYMNIRECYAPKVKPIPTRGQYAIERLKALGYIQ